MKGLILIAIVYVALVGGGAVLLLPVGDAPTAATTGGPIPLGPAFDPFSKGKGKRCIVDPPPGEEPCSDPCQTFNARACRCMQVPNCAF